jgi:hypothetical protein
MNRRLARNFSAWLEKILMIHKKKDGYGCIKAGYLA